MKRYITKLINKELNHPDKKVVLLLGQRRAGKTFELNRLQKENEPVFFFDMEDIDHQTLLTPSVKQLERVLGNKEHSATLLIDEIQYLEKSGSILKLLHDHFPNLKIVATGSASFLMMKNIGDSLYGRYFTFPIFPMTVREIIGEIDNEIFSVGQFQKEIYKPQIDAMIGDLLLFGSLPEIVQQESTERKKETLTYYVDNLVYKDIFEIERIKYPQIFRQLLQLLALQIGQIVNPNELSKTLGINRKTVLEYISLYEKFHLIYILRPYFKNKRKEIIKSFKIYFTDLGIRNSILKNYKNLSLRNDVGEMFENLVVMSFIANIHYLKAPYQIYFWRNQNKAEVDLVLHHSENDTLTPMEIKWTKTKMPPESFSNLYNDKIQESFCINKSNFWMFI